MDTLLGIPGALPPWSSSLCTPCRLLHAWQSPHGRGQLARQPGERPLQSPGEGQGCPSQRAGEEAPSAGPTGPASCPRAVPLALLAPPA